MDNSPESPPSVACERCLPVLKWHLRDRTVSSGGEILFEHHTSNDFLKASSNSCPLCRVFWAQIGHFHFIESAKYAVAAYWKTSTISRVELKLRGIENGIDEKKSDIDSKLTPRVDITCEDDILANVSSWPYPWGTFDQRFEIVKAWMNECQANHKDCSAPDSFTLRPRRLIHIGSDDSQPPRVVEFPTHDDGPGQVAPTPSFPQYTALSHCWGPPTKRPLRLLRDNAELFQGSIPQDDLAQNFKEAMSITQRLGLEHIWIDSLCIVQDDPEDWQIEAAKMASIYANGYATLAAHDAPDPHAGFIYERQQGPEKFRGTAELSGPDGTRRSLVFRRARDTTTEQSPLSNTVLSGRGWTLQEMILSKRTVHFSRGQLRWQCRQCYRTEDSPEEIKLFKTVTSPNTLSTPLSTLNTVNQDRVQVAQIWQSWVSDYSKRKLTYGSDRGPAIAGMVQFFQSRRGTPMLGLWKETLELDLVWQPKHLYNKRQLKRARPQTPFPTWSWLSIMGEESPMVTFSDPTTDGVTIRVRDFSVSWAGPDFTSPLKESRLLLSGIVRPAKMLVVDKDLPHAKLVSMDGEDLGVDCYPDFAEDCVESKVSLLHLYHVRLPTGGTHDFFLVLASVPNVDEQPVYRRICRCAYGPGRKVVEFDEAFRTDIEVR